MLALMVALVLGGWLVLRHQAQTFGEGLVRDATAVEARQFELKVGTPGLLMDAARGAADADVANLASAEALTS